MTETFRTFGCWVTVETDGTVTAEQAFRVFEDEREQTGGDVATAAEETTDAFAEAGTWVSFSWSTD